MRIHGARVRDADARRLVASLVGTGWPEALGAAGKIVRALDRQHDVHDLSPFERDAVLRSLVDPPDALVELRGALARDFARRVGLPLASARGIALWAGIAAGLRGLLAR